MSVIVSHVSCTSVLKGTTATLFTVLNKQYHFLKRLERKLLLEIEVSEFQRDKVKWVMQ